MAFTKTMTAPLAIVKIGGVAIGKMKNLRISESIRRGQVRGLGALNPSELPALEWDGTLNASFYLIDFSVSPMARALIRNTGTVEKFVDTVLLQDPGIQIDIMRKVTDTVSASGVITSKVEIFASVNGCFATRESMDITESQISGRDMDFEYVNPILFSV